MPSIRRSLLAGALLLTLSSARAAGGTRTDTTLVSLRLELLARTRVLLQGGDPVLRPALERLRADADRMLATRIVSVMDKKRMPPGGNRHDYLSIAPYWWPDSATPTGLPYVRKDGQRNPETLNDYDATRLKQMTDAVTTMALADYFVGGDQYAPRAALWLHAWFVDSSTRMNPNLTYGQGIPGITAGRGIGIIETRGLVRMLDAVSLLASSGRLVAEDRLAVGEWMSAYLAWLLTSKNGADEHAAKNNHGSWYDAQTAALALFLGRRDLARRIVLECGTRRIAAQITPTGRQPLEEHRTRSLDYSVFNLEALMQLAEIGRQVGVDLWHYRAPNGASIRGALDFLATFADAGARWHGQQITTVDPMRLHEVLRLGDLAFRDPRYADRIARLPQDRVSTSRLQLLYPPEVVRGALQTHADLALIEHDRVRKTANGYLSARPITVTAYRAERSAGSAHDFYSEGDYWWPDPANPEGPYIRRDGETNPANFVAHRDAMRRLSLIVPALVAAFDITHDRAYANHAADHLRAWFVAESTRMSPNLLYGQAIKGVATGRGTGIIDTIHLVEVARAVEVLERLGGIDTATLAATKAWFRDYLTWITTHPYGIDEHNATNNHSVAWAMQVAEFARLVDDQQRLSSTRAFLTDTIIPTQMAADGGFPRELGRTKPYGYSLFQLDEIAMVTEILSTPSIDLWSFTTPDGRGMRKAMEFMYPYIKDKRAWPRPPDVMYYDQWPVRHPALLFAGRALHEQKYLDLWKTLNPDPTVDEVVRNYPIRQPLLWVGPDP